jgi:hypothetical protein
MRRLERDLQIVVDYCKENIWEWETRVSLALDKIDMWRAPLEQVDRALYNEIEEAISDCAMDYDIDYDNICAEDVIWF